jgi:hypothetical protein
VRALIFKVRIHFAIASEQFNGFHENLGFWFWKLARGLRLSMFLFLLSGGSEREMVK